MPTFLATTATKALRTYALLWLHIWMSRLLGVPSQDNDHTAASALRLAIETTHSTPGRRISHIRGRLSSIQDRRFSGALGGKTRDRARHDEVAKGFR